MPNSVDDYARLLAINALNNGGGGSIPDNSIAEIKLNNAVKVKLNNIVNIKSFGVVGDGIANDTVAIQSAITYAVANNIGKVYFPAGTYAVKNLSLTSNIEYYGDGMDSIILSIAGTAVGETTVLIQSRTNILVHDLVFDGNKSVNTDGNDQDGIHLCDTFFTSHITFLRVWFQNNVYAGTRYVPPASGVADANFLHCRCLQTDCGIVVLGSNNLIDFRVEDCIIDGHSASEGIAVYHTGDASNITIRNNTVRNKTLATGIYVGSKNTGYLRYNVIIDGNIVYNTASGISLRYCIGGNVTNNIVRGTVSGSGMTIQDCSYVTVSGNYSYSAYQMGMSIKTCSNCIFANNLIDNYNPNNVAGAYGGVLFDTVTNSIFEYNRITNTIVSSTMMDLVFNTGVSSGLKIRNNYLGGKIYVVNATYLVTSDITLESYTEIFNNVINLTSNRVTYDKTDTITLATNTTMGRSGKPYQSWFRLLVTSAVTTTGFTYVDGQDGQERTIWIPALAYALTLTSSATTVFTTDRTLASGSRSLLKFRCQTGVWYEV